MHTHTASSPLAFGGQPMRAADHRDAVDVYVGAQIRARRQALGISQTDLAEACGLTFQQIQKYENARNRVSCSMLSRIARKLGCAPAWFFPPEGEGEPALDDTLARALAGDGGALLRAFQGASAEGRACLLGAAKALAREAA